MNRFDDLIRYIDVSLRDLAICIQKRAKEKYNDRYGPIHRPDREHEKMLDSLQDLFCAALRFRNEVSPRSNTEYFTKDKEFFYEIDRFLLLCKETYGFVEEDALK